MARVVAVRRSGSWQRIEPLKLLFRCLTSVRFALLLLGAVALAALLGVIFPQATDDVRSVPAAYDAFVQFQRSRYGDFAPLLRRLDLFAVFHSYWFNGLVMVLLLAVAVCTASRIPPIVRAVRRPPRRVNDRYFETTRHRAAFPGPADAAAIASALRRRRYRVEVTQNGEATYLFADRFAWAQYGTFVSHLALILFLAGAIVTKVVGFSTFVQIAEGRSEPVFPTIHAGQMQVENLRSAAETDKAGNLFRYISTLAVYRDGKQICSGSSTVNNPMHCAGYTFHQTTFTPMAAALEVRDVATNRAVYSEVVPLGTQGTAPGPRVVIRDAAGSVVFDNTAVLVPAGRQKLAVILALPRPDGTALPVLLVAEEGQQRTWTFQFFHPPGADPNDAPFTAIVAPGQAATAGGYTFAIPSLAALPASDLTGIPGMPAAAFVQLVAPPDGQPYLDLVNLAGQSADQTAAAAPTSRLDLPLGMPQVVAGQQYTFVGLRSITGITVRKDPGSTFIWVATALLLLGLGITFYLPRRRLWVKVDASRVAMAGVADRMVDFAAEMRAIAAAAGIASALTAADQVLP